MIYPYFYVLSSPETTHTSMIPVLISFLKESSKHLSNHRVVFEPQMQGGGGSIGHSFVIIQCLIDIRVLTPASTYVWKHGIKRIISNRGTDGERSGLREDFGAGRWVEDLIRSPKSHPWSSEYRNKNLL